MMPSQEYTFLSSTLVKEVASFGGSIKGLVPSPVERAIKQKFKKK
jgi:pantetheine-phosphate adenylyltransferase